ncbi:MAG: PilZ domain-containing protein [Elusimicrobia bacterium]|nr:PilZ domain-containing protein [Elusimicrobiota bacterium]
MIEDRRKDIRFPVMRNVGEPVELRFNHNHKNVTLPGFILNLSAGGMKIVTLGHQVDELHEGSHFVIDLKLPNLVSHNVEGKIVRIKKGEKAKLHHSNEEWFLGLLFTKIKPSDAHTINRMAEDWSVCETKLQMGLPDVCFRECAYWKLCEKSVRLPEKNGH